MTDEKKPDRFEEKAREVVGDFMGRRGFSVTPFHFQDLYKTIAKALREEADKRDPVVFQTDISFENQLVSEAELEILAEKWAAKQGETRCNQCNRDVTSSFVNAHEHAFREGFRKAMEMRATMDMGERVKQGQERLQKELDDAVRQIQRTVSINKSIKEKLGVK